MKFTRRQCLLTAVTGAAIGGSGLWLHDATSSAKEIQAMQAFTNHMKTFCVGRFLIEAPASVQNASGTYGMEIASVEARPSPYPAAANVLQALDLEIVQREADLRHQPLSPKGSSRFLELFKGGSAVRIVYYLTPGLEPRGKADGYVARDGGVFFFQANANAQADAEKLLEYLSDIESSLTMLAHGEIPSTPGFCIGKGLIATNPDRGENVDGWAWTLPGHPELSFGISTITNDILVEPGALDREASILREAASVLMHVKTLRKRRFYLNGMAAQEWLVETTDDAPEYQFNIENARPFIKLTMKVGGASKNGYAKPSLTTGEALALWDALIQTLRPRPGAV